VTQTVVIGADALTLADVRAVACDGTRVIVAASARAPIEAARAYVERLIAEGRVVYGITTGFGKFSDVTIAERDVVELQRNLVLSHCCGVGEPLGDEATRAMMLLRANVLAKGHSGVRYVVLDTIVQMLNSGLLPVIPSQGSVGASGDLVPLAHLASVMIGEGEARWQGRRLLGCDALTAAGIEPLELRAKEGLALINGTQLMSGIGVLVLAKAEIVAKCADIAGAMTLEALRGTDAAYLPLTHEVRPHPGQLATARNMLRLLEGSEILLAHCDPSADKRVQDAYSLRCIPQVHGAAKDALGFVRRVLEIEVNSSTDNPLVFPSQDRVVSGGNFHGQPLSQAMDILGMAITYTAGICERRVEYMLDPATSDHLPAFLTQQGGLHCGLMIDQVMAAGLVSENKTLAHPACVDSIPTSANKEDYVSMGAWAARKAESICQNALMVLAVELLCAAQALEFGNGLRPGRGVEAAYRTIRAHVPPLHHDRAQTPDIEKVARLALDGSLVRSVEKVVGVLELG
jgi:histidine ammonia-lyase